MTAGIDQSLSATGITIYDNLECKHYYYLIVPDNKMTKKQKEFQLHPQWGIELKSYHTPDGLDEYSKFVRVANLVDIIEEILLYHKVNLVIMEGIAYQAVGRVSDLTGLQYLIRNVCYNDNIPFVIIPASTVKKDFTGNGRADKEMMTESFSKCTGLTKSMFPFKLDDIADSYAMCHIDRDTVNWYQHH